MPTRTSLRVALLAGASAVCAVPATADAAVTMTPSGACFVQAEGRAQVIGAAVSGLGAGQNVSLRLSRDGVPAGAGVATVADPVGNVALGMDAWSVALGNGPSREVGAALEVVDAATGAALVSSNVALANVAYSVTGKGRLRSWKVQGLAALAGNATYYAHYMNHGKYKGRQKLGTGQGPCGYLSVKKPLTPFKKLGRYDVTIQASKKLDKSLPSFKGRVTVKTRYR